MFKISIILYCSGLWLLMIGCISNNNQKEPGIDFPALLSGNKEDAVWCIEATLEQAELAGATCLRVHGLGDSLKGESTLNIDVISHFGQPVDLIRFPWLLLDIFVPDETWISVFKLKLTDTAGNSFTFYPFFNNMPGNKGRWVTVASDLNLGDGDPANVGDLNLSAVSILTFIIVNGDMGHNVEFCLKGIRFAEKRPAKGTIPSQVLPIDTVDVTKPYTYNFEDRDYLVYMSARQGIEARRHTLASGIGGNQSVAYGTYGHGKDRMLFFLFKPAWNQGKPIDFHNFTKIKFRYYIPENSSTFTGSFMHIALPDWREALHADSVFSNFVKGSWQEALIDIHKLNFSGDKEVSTILSEVGQIKFDFYYPANAPHLEIWVDDFGWE